MKKKGTAQRTRAGLWLAFASALLALLVLRRCAREERTDAASPAPSSAPKLPRVAEKKPRFEPRAQAPGRAVGCVSGASVRCVEGDVWSLDSCGQREEKLDECDVQLCREGACEEPDEVPCLEPAEGRCDGSTVRLCYAGRAMSIDCGARGMRCGQGEEGAECAPLLSPADACFGPTRCERDVLVRCRDGARVRVDCREQGAHCMLLPGAREPTCVALRTSDPASEACGPCGCPASAAGERLCDGRDDDSDQRVDEGLDCGAVPLRAFVVSDERGNSSFSREEIEAEVAQVNRLLEAEPDGTPLRFALAEVAPLSEPSWLEMSHAEVQAAALDARLHPAQPEFYVPVVFTDLLFADGDVPRAGASTLPNGFCGGSPRGQGADVGLVAIAKGRSRTTLLHELGHFFGLCHTHELTSGVGSAFAQDAGVQSCAPLCRDEGDGLCDTPPDPGPESCSFDAHCQVSCARGERPDPQNLMSYYTACRARFTPDQLRLVTHTLALRRAWHPCLTAGCPCRFETGDCPPGMSCRPDGQELRATGHCGLNGTRAPGAACAAHSQCGEDSLCLSREPDPGRCVRVCSASAPGCACIATNLGIRICKEDVGGAL